MTDLVARVQWLEDHGIKFQSLHENIDTSTTISKLVFHIFEPLAEFERNLVPAT